MKIGMTAGCYQKELSVFRAEVETLRRVGFDCIDYQGFINTKTELFQMNDGEFDAYVCAQKEILDSVGLTVSQVHGPWRWPALDATDEDRSERFEKMTRTIHGTTLLGCDRMVLHNLMPQNRIDTDPAYVKAVNKEFFSRLCTVAKEHGVTICLENMPFPSQSLARPRETLEFVRELNLENFRVCLDTGHAEVLGSAPGQAVRLIGKEYLYALHVHDTDGLRDRHWLIGDGVIDWADFCAALREIGFEGCFSIESVVKAEIGTAEFESQLQKLYIAAKAITKA